ncbi:MAG: CvpA family protein [Hyphomicrobiales bacterium]|nr:CvpA family protein [Hyphomicrobiales bacterium]
MPAYLDIGLIAVILISALLSMLRGFTREILAIAAWVVAGLAAWKFYPRLMPTLLPHVHKPLIAIALSAAIIFLVVLVLVSILTVRISDLVLDSKIGAVDRSLGFVFGAARGLLLCVVAFLFFNFLMQDKKLPDWAAHARSTPMLASLSQSLQDMIPADAASSVYQTIDKIKPGVADPNAASTEPAPAASTAAPAATPAATAPGK